MPIRKMRLPKTLISLGFSAISAISPVNANQGDGFNAYCTSNMDGTGACFNDETSKKMSCLIVPGQIIDCKTRKGKTFQCVWTSNITANQAQFWCDPSAESILNDDFKDATTDSFSNDLNVN